MSFQTTDLCDAHEAAVSVVEPMFRSYGGRTAFAGQISTVKCFEDNSLVREALGKPGAGKVLVVDGGGSLRCALLGDQLAALAEKNRWEGVVVYGCIRDSEAIDRVAIGVRALATHPMKSVKKGVGETEVPVTFGGVTFRPGHYLYADADGIIVAATALS
jgi:regulator of ribonuclease activity A